MGDVRVSEDVLGQVEQAAILRPGDTLILRLASSVTADVAKAVADAFRERYPDLDVLLVGSVEEMAVYRPEPPLISVQLSPQDTDEAATAVAEYVQRSAARQSQQRRRTG